MVFGITLTLFYLFDRKFSDLMLLSFLQLKKYAPKKSAAPQMFCASKHARSKSGANCPGPLLRDHNLVKIDLQLINLTD